MGVRLVRFHNISGPQGNWKGDREKAPAAMCHKVATAKLTNNLEIEIWENGKQTRLICCIDDCIEGLQKLIQSDDGQPLNLGQDRLVTDIAGTPITKNHIFGPQGVRGRYSDNSRLREVLGWQPGISLEQGLGYTCAWIEAHVQKNWRAKRKLSSSRNSQREPVSVLCPISSEPPRTPVHLIWRERTLQHERCTSGTKKRAVID